MMPSLQVVWVLIGFVPAMMDGKPPIPVTMRSGAVFAVEARCNDEADNRRSAMAAALPGPAGEAILIRCMPYWINRKGARR